MRVIEDDEIRDRFAHHKLDPDEAQAVDMLREQFVELALSVNRLLPDGREKSLALTKLREASMWSNQGIARGG